MEKEGGEPILILDGLWEVIMSTSRLPPNTRNDMYPPLRARILLKADLRSLAIFIILFNRFESLHFLSKAKAAGRAVPLGPETIFPSGFDEFLFTWWYQRQGSRDRQAILKL